MASRNEAASVLKSNKIAPKYLLTKAMYDIAVARGGISDVPDFDELYKSLVLKTDLEFSYRATIPEYNDELFVLRVQAPRFHEAAVDLIYCDLHNQLGMTFITLVSEFAALLPWAQHILENPSMAEDYSDMSKALQRVRNSYRDFRDEQLSCNLAHVIRTYTERLLRLPTMLHECSVRSTSYVHPGMPTCFRSGITFGIFVVHAFHEFDSFFQDMLAQRAKTETRT